MLNLDYIKNEKDPEIKKLKTQLVLKGRSSENIDTKHFVQVPINKQITSEEYNKLSSSINYYKNKWDKGRTFDNYAKTMKLQVTTENILGNSTYFGATSSNGESQNLFYPTQYGVSSFTITYRHTQSEYEAIKNHFLKVISQIIPKKASDELKVAAVHDYICAHLTYDYVNMNNHSMPIAAQIRDPYLYVNSDYNNQSSIKAGVCEAYAKAFSLMLTYLNIPIWYVTGDAWQENDSYSGGHAWNMVKLNNKYYYYDCTWDDNDDRTSAKRTDFSYQNKYMDHLVFNTTWLTLVTLIKKEI